MSDYKVGDRVIYEPTIEGRVQAHWKGYVGTVTRLDPVQRDRIYVRWDPPHYPCNYDVHPWVGNLRPLHPVPTTHSAWAP